MSRYLLDSHILLWWLADAPQTAGHIRDVLASGETVKYISSASIWELCIKSASGKLKLPRDFVAVVDSQPVERLEITHEHAQAAAALPAHHNDPFDRMLIAQAQIKGLTLLTNDRIFQRYDVRVALN